MESRLFLEFVSSQFVATAVGVIDQFSIVYCNVVLRSATSTSLNLLLVTVFPAKIRRKYLEFGEDLFD